MHFLKPGYAMFIIEEAINIMKKIIKFSISLFKQTYQKLNYVTTLAFVTLFALVEPVYANPPAPAGDIPMPDFVSNTGNLAASVFKWLLWLVTTLLGGKAAYHIIRYFMSDDDSESTVQFRRFKRTLIGGVIAFCIAGVVTLLTTVYKG